MSNKLRYYDKCADSIEKKIFSVEDFNVFGARYGINYRFPSLADDADKKSAVLQGNVEEMTLASGICLTHSDVQVLQPYETTSCHSSPLYMLVVLDGCVTLSLNGTVYRVSRGMAFSSCLSEQQVMSARHDANRNLKTLSFGVYPDDAWRDSLLGSLLQEWQHFTAPTSVWQVPGFVLAGLEDAQRPALDALARRLLLEGLMYQLLGHGLLVHKQHQHPERQRYSLQGEQQRLALVRRMLEEAPEKPHSLAELAQLAAMSSSSLRSKFRQYYGCSLFDYLRDCRLSLARRYLLEGHSVQQAAWMSGYQHATNFATAFRRRYGVAPSRLANA